MIVAGIMSGTSADGIDIALVRLTDRQNRTGQSAGGSFNYPRLYLLAHQSFSYPAVLRRSILAAMNARAIATADLARLNWRLGLAYAEALQTTLETHPSKLDLIGCHGQTLYHQGTPKLYAGRKFSCTWQLGEPSLLAASLHVPVVSNFRPADMVVGGQGAPLVPLLDFVLFSHPKRGRVLQNIGGIANLTAIPPNSTADQAQAFDTGPGNMLIDQLMQTLYGKSMDKDGATAATGQVLASVLQQSLRLKFFSTPPPRSAGREEFGREYASAFWALCRNVSRRKQDAITTATALTATSISQAYLRFASPMMQTAPVDYIVSGGGARNKFLMNELTLKLETKNCKVSSIDRFGLPAEAKEAAAFALLAYQTWHRRPGNLPSATGSTRAAILGQLTYA